MKKYLFDNWDITVHGRQQIGNKQSMEDVVWFQPPFRNEQNGYTYLQLFVLDGHRVFPLKLDEVRSSAIRLTQSPLTQRSVQNWATQEDSKWNQNVDGGVVIQFISIEFEEISENSTCHINRFQIGDCNSVVFNQEEILLPCMNSHNVQNEDERKRFKSRIHEGRILGTLQCTRVIGNKMIKSQLKDHSLDPIVEVDSNTIANKQTFIVALGSDGCFQESFKTSLLLQQIQSIKPFRLESIGDTWMQHCSGSDNASLILISFQHLSIIHPIQSVRALQYNGEYRGL